MKRLCRTVPNTVEGHWDMAERCRKAGLKTQRDTHLQKVLELDPNHRRHGGDWASARLTDNGSKPMSG